MWFKFFKKSIEFPSNKEIAELALQKNLDVMETLHKNMERLSGKLIIVLADMDALDQKFELLTNMLGIEIASDCVREPPSAYVKSMSDKSLFASAKKYIDATVTAEKVLALHYKTMRQQSELLKNIEWRANDR